MCRTGRAPLGLVLGVSMALFGCVLENGEPPAPLGPFSPSVVSPDGALPVSDFTVTPATPEQFQSVFFASSSIVQDQSFSWDFGDGASTTGDPVSHTYTEPSTYRVTLSVVDGQGRSGSVAKNVTVSPPSSQPEAVIIFSPTDPAVGQTVFFDGTASTAPAGRSIDGYVWNFGDGETQTRPHPVHIYSTADTFVVRLTVTDSRGFSASTTQEIKVGSEEGGSAGPTASFTVSPTTGTTDTVFNFDASASGPQSTIETYTWNFGDGTFALEPTVTHKFTTADTYSVRLMVTDDQGRTDTTAQTLKVKEP